MSDPGLALKSATLGAAWSLLQDRGAAIVPTAALPEDAAEAVEELALAAGMRSRRVLLDGAWWREAAAPMLARVADRRRVPREQGPPPGAAGTGWVVLLARAGGGYRMLAPQAAGDPVAQWTVDAEVAARLAPFAFTFHRRFAPRALGARDILRFAFAHGGRDLAVLLAAGLAAALVGLLTPVATGWLIDRAIPAADGGAVGGVIAALAIAGLALVALDLVRTFAVLRFETRLGAGMQAALVDRMISAPARFFRGFSSGDLALRMASVNTVHRTITGSTIGTFVTSLFLLANLGLMLAYSAALTLAASGILVLVVALSTTLGLMRLKIGPRIEALDGSLSAMGYEIFSGIAKLRAAAAEPRVLRQWYARYGAFRSANGDSARLSNLEAVALSLLRPAATILVLALAWKLTSGAAMSTGDFVAFHAALFGLLGGVHALVYTAIEVVNLKPVWDRARPILETPPEDAGGGALRHDPRGAIALENVSFAYPDGPEVLRDIDLRIAPGEFVAIVGASGSGKSTLLRLLLGFEAPARGSVRYDGHDLASLDLRHLRGRLGTVLQGGKLWAGDLLANIVGATSLGAEAAWEAARAAGLAADIEALPMGLYTVVGEGLSTLSGGQRQRLLLARALAGKPRVLLLDEATSALDNVSQATVLAGLAGLAATRLVIAHRLNTVRHADRIVVLERGRIVQQGTYRELAQQRGAFSAMLARQVA
ncbi:MAG TPA: NHLP bacteriocin export ABC transporter permease/ATPase subunit [Myxococcota bacterium]|nr:NHLP bacteriocin export ABC transporter permease/ATPase subunit [Myxococcota bacterium]